MMSFPSEQHASALPKMRGVDTIIHQRRGKILPTHPLSYFILIVPSDIHLHNGGPKNRLPMFVNAA